VQSNAVDVEPAAKRPRLEEASPLDLLDVKLQADCAPPDFTVADEVTEYLRQPNIQRQLNPMDWWRQHERWYLRVADIVRRYLSAPSTSVASTRLFSSAGDMYSDSRNCVADQLAEKLLFIKHNLKYV